MKRILVFSMLSLLFMAVGATAAVVITLNGYRGVSVMLEPVGLCGPTGDCVFVVTVRGDVLDSTGMDRSNEVIKFRTDDPIYLAAPYNINPTTTTNLYRKSRRAWKSSVLADDTD